MAVDELELTGVPTEDCAEANDAAVARMSVIYCMFTDAGDVVSEGE